MHARKSHHPITAKQCLKKEAKSRRGFVNRSPARLNHPCAGVGRENVDPASLDPPFTEVRTLLVGASCSRMHLVGNFGQVAGSSIVFKQLAKHHWDCLNDWDAEGLHFTHM